MVIALERTLSIFSNFWWLYPTGLWGEPHFELKRRYEMQFAPLSHLNAHGVKAERPAHNK